MWEAPEARNRRSVVLGALRADLPRLTKHRRCIECELVRERDRASVKPEILAVNERHHAEQALLGIEGAIAPAIDHRECELACGVITRVGARHAAKRIASELIEQQDEREPAVRLRLPIAELSRQRALDGARKPGADLVIDGSAAGVPALELDEQSRRIACRLTKPEVVNRVDVFHALNLIRKRGPRSHPEQGGRVGEVSRAPRAGLRHNWAMAHSLESSDIRALLRLLAELRELGREPEAWRTHLVRSLERICDANVCLALELQVNPLAAEGVTNCAQVVTPLQAVAQGLNLQERDKFFREIYYIDHATDDALGGIVPLYGSVFTVRRGDVLSDRRWDRSQSANERFRPLGVDDFVMSMVPVSALGVMSCFEIYRGRGKRFGERERLFVSLLHEELAHDWQREDAREQVRLTPRQREVLARLAAGASEKEIAYELGLSPHTTHDHIKALHRAFNARSRGELLAQALRPTPPATCLVAQQA